MHFQNTLELLMNFIKKLPQDQVVAISDDRLCIWQYIVTEHFPTSLISLYEETVWGLFGTKLYINAEKYGKWMELWSYFYFPQWSSEDILYRQLIDSFSYEIDLKLALRDDVYDSWLSYNKIPLILSPQERTANVVLLDDFLYIDSRNEFLLEMSHHAKYHEFFYGNEVLQEGYAIYQNKLQSLLLIYKYLSNNIPSIDGVEYRTVQLALMSEINKIRFHVELTKKAMFFGYKTLSHVKIDLEKDFSLLEVTYQENIWNIERETYWLGNLSKVYNRDDIKNFPKWAIMVAYNTNPEYMAAFLSAKAVIVENASQLSHAAITCREFSIPWALGASGCMGFQNNATLEIDTQNKIIQICQK